MLKTVTRLMAATAALGLVSAPIIANANTRAGDSGIVQTSSMPGLGRASAGEGQAEEGEGGSLLLSLAAGSLFVLGGLVAFDVIGGDDDCASPGACG